MGPSTRFRKPGGGRVMLQLMWIRRRRADARVFQPSYFGIDERDEFFQLRNSSCKPITLLLQEGDYHIVVLSVESSFVDERADLFERQSQYLAGTDNAGFLKIEG